MVIGTAHALLKCMNNLIQELEMKLKLEWAEMNQAKGQDEYRRLKAKAIKTFNELKKQRIQNQGV